LADVDLLSASRQVFGRESKRDTPTRELLLLPEGLYAMSRLIVVSNRVADLRKSAQSGGLAVGMADALRERERGGVWFGWDGKTLQAKPQPPEVEDIGKVKKISVSMSVQDYSEYYIGYANSVLWPLFHYRLDLVDYRLPFFEGYCRVNANFAASLAPFLRADDIIWVHDYHLIPFARCLQDLGCTQRIGFFLHIPFPPPDLFSASPNHNWLAEALLQYDVVGFQTYADLANFKLYVDEHTSATVLEDGRIRAGDRLIVAERFPIGIDVETFAALAQEASVDVQIDMMRREILGRKQVIGVDRLDYSKGLPARFEAFDRLLAHHPELEKAVTLLQIAPPTREDVNAYSDIRAELERLAGSINGKYADFNWTPIRYIHRSVARTQLAGLFRASQVGFVTPLRDGMNLVAKEYVAAQDEEDPGVLVLSQFAGAAEEMQEALIVNPYDVEDMAEKLFQGLAMPLEERRRRHKALLERIRKHDARTWMESFLAALEPPPAQAPRSSNGVTRPGLDASAA
jgi:trehalose 6-phosphate synthase